MFSPSLPVLQPLHRLDRSAPGFHEELSEVLYGEEYRACLSIVQGDDLVWLIDYLDEVRRHVFLPPLYAEAIVGSRWSRSFHCCFPEVPLRT